MEAAYFLINDALCILTQYISVNRFYDDSVIDQIKKLKAIAQHSRLFDNLPKNFRKTPYKGDDSYLEVVIMKRLDAIETQLRKLESMKKAKAEIKLAYLQKTMWEIANLNNEINYCYMYAKTKVTIDTVFEAYDALREEIDLNKL